MASESIPYLCGGTFFTQLLRARPVLTTSTEHTKGYKESLSEQETFRRLISVYQMKDFMNCSSLKTYTSQFKTCTNSLEAFTSFSDADMKWSFDKDVKSSDSSALILMSEFVQEFTDPDKYIQLTRCLLGMIKSDHTIKFDTPFYIFENGAFVTKEKMIEMESFVIEPFLLGIWHFIIMHRSDCNERGAATYQQWYPNRGKYAGTVSDCITQEIFVESIPKAAEDNNFEDKTQKATTQYINHATIVNQYGEKNVHIDHVDTLNL